MADPDFAWLISNFLEQRPQFVQLDAPSVPVVLVSFEGVPLPLPMPLAAMEDDADSPSHEDT